MSRWLPALPIPPIPIPGLGEGNRKIAGRKSGNAGHSPHSPRAGRRVWTGVRDRVIIYPSLWNKGNEGNSPLPPPSRPAFHLFPSHSPVNGNGGNREVVA